MTCGRVHASYSLPEKKAVKLTFFAPVHVLPKEKTKTNKTCGLL